MENELQRWTDVEVLYFFITPYGRGLSFLVASQNQEMHEEVLYSHPR